MILKNLDTPITQNQDTNILKNLDSDFALMRQSVYNPS